MTKAMSLAEVKARLSECVRAAENGEPVVITRYGKPVAAVVDTETLEQIRRLRAAGPQGGLASLAGGWEGSEELVEDIDRHCRTGPRDSPGLEA